MNKFLWSLAGILLATQPLTGCVMHKHQNSTQDYSALQPSLLVQQYFNGQVLGQGMVLSSDQRMTRRFTRRIKGVWKHSDGFVHETIQYTDGEKDVREWCIHLVDAHHFTGVATDTTGFIEGEQYGNAIHMYYHPDIPLDISDKLHTKDQALVRFRQSAFENTYSLLTSGGVYGTLKAINTLERQNIQPTLKQDRAKYKESDIGSFCEAVQKSWAQDAPHRPTHLLNDAWYFAIDQQTVLEKITIQQYNLNIGEVVTSLQHSK